MSALAAASHPSSPDDVAQQRWKLGHQTFHLYLVGMITLLEDLQACPDSDADRVASLIADLAALFEATAASMRYAGSFDSSAYESAIRPLMSPPCIKPGFTGLLNVEHKRMMTALAAVPGWLKERFGEEPDTWPPPLAQAWSALVDAEQRARVNHGHVCRKLVPDGPSLLRAHMAANPAVLGGRGS
jgi:hypothetical protein